MVHIFSAVVERNETRQLLIAVRKLEYANGQSDLYNTSVMVAVEGWAGSDNDI